jgi:hypothetical protein
MKTMKIHYYIPRFQWFRGPLSRNGSKKSDELQMELKNTSNNPQSRYSGLLDMISLLRKSLEETEKYELLTTNEYLSQMELLIGLIDEIIHTLKELPDLAT